MCPKVRDGWCYFISPYSPAGRGLPGKELHAGQIAHQGNDFGAGLVRLFAMGFNRGKYLIMGNGTRAFAVAAEQAQRDNPLKTAEQTIEQNGNMIDGIINNTPTVDELEAKVKAGEQISLVDLANAVKADKERGKGAKPEKKPSIRAQLRADKEKAQKKNAKQKSQDLERS